jgi:FkbM family methyltransferase
VYKLFLISINNGFIIKTMYNEFHGEVQDGKTCDQTLREYFPDYDYKGVFFDVGAFDPIKISNSYHFEKNGWRTFCFEANTSLIPELKLHRENVYNYAIAECDKDSVTFNVVISGGWAAGFSAINIDPRYIEKWGDGISSQSTITVPQKSLNSLLLEEIKDVEHIDILSIDVEGGELNVLKGLDIEKYKPTIILVEDVFDDRELIDYILDHGYILDKSISYNKYFLRKKLKI